ncbi:MAG: DnaA/Hda family protein [Alphaproteobacteria bacterium]
MPPSPGQIAFEFDHRPALGCEDFVVAPCNREAVAWIDRWPDWPGPALAIFGPPGCGKTHLGRVWQARSKARHLDPVALARPGHFAAFEPGTGCWIVENLCLALGDQDLGDQDLAQPFLHVFNRIAEAKGQLLVVDRAPPARWPVALKDLASRLAAMPAVAVGPPDDALIGAVLVKLFADRQLKVAPEVVIYLLARMERSFEAATELVAAIDTAALTAGRNVTVPLVGEVLRASHAPE